VRGAVRHDDPDAAAKLETIHAGSARLPEGWSWRARWRADLMGACVRCGTEANTEGPDGRPWHPFCWGAAGTPPATPTYRAGTRLRPRHLALAAGPRQTVSARSTSSTVTHASTPHAGPASHAAATPDVGARPASSRRPATG
jgi:hypothetical protein